MLSVKERVLGTQPAGRVAKCFRGQGRLPEPSERRSRPPARPAGQLSETLILGDPEGVHTVELTVKGLSGCWSPRTAPSCRRGHIVFREVFDGEEFVAGRSSSRRDSANLEERLGPVLRRRRGCVGLN